MTPEQYAEFLAWLDEYNAELITEIMADHAQGCDMHSYGSGHDNGLLEGLNQVKQYLLEHIK